MQVFIARPYAIARYAVVMCLSVCMCHDVCVCVCVCVCHAQYIKTAKPRITQTTPQDIALSVSMTETVAKDICEIQMGSPPADGGDKYRWSRLKSVTFDK